jgi:hypothetical protein
LRNFKIENILLFVLLFAAQVVFAQKATKVKGVVLDAKTGEPIPFAAVSFKNKNIGSITSYTGAFILESNFATDIIVVSSLGYEPEELNITLYSNNNGLKIRLRPLQVELDQVDIVTTKPKKYKNKGNPAVELIRNVIIRRKDNRMRSLDSYSVHKYQKVEIDINNITQKFMDNPIFKNFPEIFDYVDTSEINGKPYLPLYMYETISDVYYQKKPAKTKELVSASRAVGFDEHLDGEGISAFIKNIIQEVDIYKSNILFLEKEFSSPISNIAPSVYRYYILDTVYVDNVECTELGFMPRNAASYSFKGKIWITTDSTYAVKKAELGMTNEININWLNTFLISQIFDKSEYGMLLKESHTTIDFDLDISDKGTGVFGKKSDYFENYNVNISIPDTILKGSEIRMELPGSLNRDSIYWDNNRLMPLTESEKSIKMMTDHIQSMPSFNFFIRAVNVFLSGYYDFGKIEVGPLGSVYSFNQIEGFRMGLGLRTTEDFNYHWQLKVFGAYGFNDKVWKYSGRVKYFWDRKLKNYISIQYKRDYYFPGEIIDFVRADNFFFSFKRGEQDKMVDFTFIDLEYSHEFSNLYRLVLTGKTGKQSGLGTLNFVVDSPNEQFEIEQFNSFDIGIKQRFTPNQKYYSGKNSRSLIITNHPIYEVTYRYGQSIDNLYQFKYHKLNFRFFKRSNVGILGYNDILVELEKTFGSGVPFLFMRMHAANQTYTFQEYSANMMNYLEFVSDQYAYLIFTQYFDGLIFNQIPLLKKLKWRSLVSARVLYGNVSDPNNPLKTPGLVQFPTDALGNATTFSLGNVPYIEASIGIENILNLLRVDIVKRFTYLDNPNLPDLWGVKGLGVRFKFRVNF